MDHPVPEWRGGPRYPLRLHYKLDLRECVRILSGRTRLQPQPEALRPGATACGRQQSFDAHVSGEHGRVRRQRVARADRRPEGSEGHLQALERDGLAGHGWSGFCTMYFNKERNPIVGYRPAHVLGLEIKLAHLPADHTGSAAVDASSTHGALPPSGRPDDPPGPVVDKDKLDRGAARLRRDGTSTRPRTRWCGNWYVHIRRTLQKQLRT